MSPLDVVTGWLDEIDTRFMHLLLDKQDNSFSYSLTFDITYSLLYLLLPMTVARCYCPSLFMFYSKKVFFAPCLLILFHHIIRSCNLLEQL